MLAPLLVPPCFTASVAELNTFMKLTGPLATPPVDLTAEPLWRSLENENPVPPPDLCMRAAFLTESKIPSMLSSTGRTKHAESCPRVLPAFIRVGELGRNLRSVMSSKNSSLTSLVFTVLSYFASTAAIVSATRLNISSTVSTTLPSSSLARYLFSSTVRAFFPISLIAILFLPNTLSIKHSSIISLHIVVCNEILLPLLSSGNGVSRSPCSDLLTRLRIYFQASFLSFFRL